jgi:hypothetical protein
MAPFDDQQLFLARRAAPRNTGFGATILRAAVVMAVLDLGFLAFGWMQPPAGVETAQTASLPVPAGEASPSPPSVALAAAPEDQGSNSAQPNSVGADTAETDTAQTDAVQTETAETAAPSAAAAADVAPQADASTPAAAAEEPVKPDVASPPERQVARGESAPVTAAVPAVVAAPEAAAPTSPLPAAAPEPVAVAAPVQPVVKEALPAPAPAVRSEKPHRVIRQRNTRKANPPERTVVAETPSLARSTPAPVTTVAAHAGAVRGGEECRPYVADSNLVGEPVAVRGLACPSGDGSWRIVSENRLRSD